MPKTKIHWNPRVSFNYDVNGHGATQLRGGVGLFMGRINASIFAGMFQENGLLTSYTVNATVAKPLKFEANPLSQPTYNQLTGLPETSARYQVNLMDNNRRFLQLLRGNFAVDQKLPGGIIATFEVLFENCSIKIKDKTHTVQLTFDIANFTNMLNKKWGHRYTEAGPGFYEVLNFTGYVTGTKQPIYSFGDTQKRGFIINDNVTEVLSASRWLGQFGVRYSF
jgi:hypothetical protein